MIQVCKVGVLQGKAPVTLPLLLLQDHHVMPLRLIKEHHGEHVIEELWVVFTGTLAVGAVVDL